MQYKMIIWQQRNSHLRNLFAIIIIRLFEVKNLEMRVSDSPENTEEVDWDKGAIAVLAGESNVRLSKNGKLVSLALFRSCSRPAIMSAPRPCFQFQKGPIRLPLIFASEMIPLMLSVKAAFSSSLGEL
jgi:hypothetical protein